MWTIQDDWGWVQGLDWLGVVCGQESVERSEEDADRFGSEVVSLRRMEPRTVGWHTLVEGHHVKNNRGVPTHIKRGQHQWMPGPCQPISRGGHHVKIQQRLYTAWSIILTISNMECTELEPCGFFYIH